MPNLDTSSSDSDSTSASSRTGTTRSTTRTGSGDSDSGSEGSTSGTSRTTSNTHTTSGSKSSRTGSSTTGTHSSTSSSSDVESSRTQSRRNDSSDSDTYSSKVKSVGKKSKASSRRDKSSSSRTTSGSKHSDSEATSSSSDVDSSNEGHTDEDERSDERGEDYERYRDIREEPFSPMKDWFTDLPEPRPTRQIKMPRNDYLRAKQSNIKRLKEHVRLIQTQEEDVMNKITDKLVYYEREASRLGMDEDTAVINKDEKAIRKVQEEKIDMEKEEEAARIDFLDDLATIRAKRKQYKALLHDAIIQRDRYIESYDIQQSAEKEKEEQMQNLGAKRGADPFMMGFLFVQAVIFIFYVVFFDYHKTDQLTIENLGWPQRVDNLYSIYIGMALMLFVGFSYSTAYLKKNSFTGIAHTFFIGAYAMQLGILIEGFLWWAGTEHFAKILLTIPHVIDGLYVAFTVIISYGALVGRINFMQLTVMCTVEVIGYSVNYYIGLYLFSVYDPGMSIFVHLFATLFGLTVSFMVDIPVPGEYKRIEDHSTRYNGEIFALLGTVFMWVFWPCFNSVFAPNGTQLQVVINTVLSLTGSCFVAFYGTHFFGGRFEMETIRNTSLAGGIIVGSAMNVIISGYIALILGMFAGFIVLLGQYRLSPWLEREFGVRDTRGILYLHGIPSLLAAVGGIIATAVVKHSGNQVFGQDYDTIFSREHHEQELRILAGIAVTLGLSIAFGTVAGLIVKFVRVFKIREPNFTDHREFFVSKDFPTIATRDPNDKGNTSHANIATKLV